MIRVLHVGIRATSVGINAAGTRLAELAAQPRQAAIFAVNSVIFCKNLRATALNLQTANTFAKAFRRRNIMPYIIGWFLGVPVIVLVLLYLVFN
jgi:hypothetical protein